MPIPSSPSTQLYTLGKGILYIADWVGDTPPEAVDYTDLGNAPSLEVEVTEEKLNHFSSRSGVRSKDKSVILETGYMVKFTLDEISITNLQAFLKATLFGDFVLRANTALDKEYALKFVSDNPYGPNEVWEFWKVQLSPGGAFSLIGDEWSTLSFSGEGLSDTANHAVTPFFNVTFYTTTTTTSSTTTTAPPI